MCSVGSIGEEGAYETVAEVHVRNCTFNGTMNGARIKTWPVCNNTITKNKKKLFHFVWWNGKFF